MLFSMQVVDVAAASCYVHHVYYCLLMVSGDELLFIFRLVRVFAAKDLQSLIDFAYLPPEVPELQVGRFDVAGKNAAEQEG